MVRIKRYGITVIAALCFAAALLPCCRGAEASTPVSADAARAERSLSRAVGLIEAPAPQNEELIQQIKDTYKAAKKKAKKKSFKGKCGSYVNHQLVILGVNQKFIGANGNREYDTYCRSKTTTGGYSIHAYSAKKYTLKSALEAIEQANPNARNILIGFEKGTSKLGKKYGHTLLIHGIENGNVYFSDSYGQKVNGRKYKEGDPIVCSVETFCKLYKKYTLDGVIWFE